MKWVVNSFDCVHLHQRLIPAVITVLSLTEKDLMITSAGVSCCASGKLGKIKSESFFTKLPSFLDP